MLNKYARILAEANTAKSVVIITTLDSEKYRGKVVGVFWGTRKEVGYIDLDIPKYKVIKIPLYFIDIAEPVGTGKPHHHTKSEVDAMVSRANVSLAALHKRWKDHRKADKRTTLKK